MLQDILFLGLSYFVANCFRRDNRTVGAMRRANEWCIGVRTLPTSLRLRVERTFFRTSPNIGSVGVTMQGDKAASRG